MEQATTAVAVLVADDRGTKRGFSPARLDADSKRPAVLHDAYKETADKGLTRPIIIAALAKAHKGPSKKEFTELATRQRRRASSCCGTRRGSLKGIRQLKSSVRPLSGGKLIKQATSKISQEV